MINHDLQLARCLSVGSALAEKAMRFEVTALFYLSGFFVINHDLQLARCLLISSNKKAVLDLTNTAFKIFSL